jgi:ATP-dependent exoDNAse (exonuclease V) alpha subunit
MKAVPLTDQPEINAHFERALALMQDGKTNLFITGKAGTGKSTLLKLFCQQAKHKPVVLAPTGVAALNVGGQTIHSFFRFGIDTTLAKIRSRKYRAAASKLFRKLRTLVIDEVSMLRADLLDCVDAVLRSYGPRPGQPFGGVQMVFIGDLYQLPPVVTADEQAIFRDLYASPYFFSAEVMRDLPLEIIELEHVYRQKDQRFVELLNRVRDNAIRPEDLTLLNGQMATEAKPSKKTKGLAITLTATNRQADAINDTQLAALKGKLYRSTASTIGEFGREYHPTAVDLCFKIGAQIMMLTNDSDGLWVNGSIGVIESVEQAEEDGLTLMVRLQDSGSLVPVQRHQWQVYRFGLEGQEIQAEPAGTFEQFPFRLAWAVTIHKSQGKTFEQVIVDVGSGTFAAGQLYVALSRCTSLAGITLRTPVKAQHIRTDQRIHDYMATHRSCTAEGMQPQSNKLALIKQAVADQTPLEIIYLKGNNTETTRQVRPLSLGEESYQGKSFVGMRALCLQGGQELLFSVDRILSITTVLPIPQPRRASA